MATNLTLERSGIGFIIAPKVNLEKNRDGFDGTFLGHALAITRRAGEFIARIDGEVIATGTLSDCYGAMSARIFGP